MHTKESIHQYLQVLMHDLFELEGEMVTLEARLEDLDIDSIDAVDMAVQLKELTGKRIPRDDFKHVRTIGDIVDAVYVMVNDESTEAKN